MKKVVLNKSWGGFSLSDKALKQLSSIKGHKVYDWDIERDDIDLINVVETLGEESWDDNELVVVEIPDNSSFIISDYDGMETLYYSSSEIHRM